MSICFSFGNGGFGFLGDALPVNAMEAKSRLLQSYDEIVTIRKTFLFPPKGPYHEMRKRLKFSARMS